MIDNLLRGITITPSMSDRIRVLRYYMLSRDLVSRTLKEIDADIRAGSPEAFEAMINKYRQATDISIKGNDLFIVSLRDENPVFARDFINTLVGGYVKENISDKREEAYGANRFIKEQLTHFKSKLDEAQDKIIQFRRANGIYSSVGEESLLQEIENKEVELERLRIQKNEMLASIQTIRSQLEMMKQLAQNGGFNNDMYFYGDSGGGNPLVAQLESRIDQLLLTYNEKYPEVVKLRAQIEAIKAADAQKKQSGERISAVQVAAEQLNPLEDPIYVDLKMRLNAKESDIQALEARALEIESAIAANKQKLQNFPEDKKALAELEREKRTYQSLYEQLLHRQGISEVSKQMEVADKATTFRIVDPAIIPTQPTSIDRFKVMIMGVLVGFGTGLGLIFILEKIDGKFKDSERIRELGIPVLVEIPTISNPSEEARQKKWNRVRYAFAAGGYTMVAALLLHDAMGFGFIDQFIVQTHLDQVVGRVMNIVN